MKRRGFEKVSLKRFLEDFKGYNTSKEAYEQMLIPRRSTLYSAGYDFFAPFDFILKSKEKIIIPTGIRAYMQNDEYLAIYNRSSMGFKHDISLCNQVGIIDSDYYDNENNEGHILIALRNDGNKDWVVKKNDKIAQGIFSKYLNIDSEIIPKNNRIGGIGHTDER